jgi:NADPH:quinone reductase-like Zn-dependent oxidoreductase
MKAITCSKYGPIDEVLSYREVEKPVPGDNDVLVKILASSVNYNSLFQVQGFGLMRSLKMKFTSQAIHIPGNDVAGRVEAVGRGVTRFKPGDSVFADTFAAGMGAYAEYIKLPEDLLVAKPVNLTFEQAGVVPEAACVALQGLRLGGIRAGQQVLVYGASGGIGTFAVQIAKSFGAGVTGVCSTRNLDLVRSLGAEHVIDYTVEDFTRGSHKYDLILATTGYRSIFAFRRALKPGGHHVVTGATMTGSKTLAQLGEAMLLGPLVGLPGGRKMSVLSAKPSREDLTFIKDLIEAGKVKPVIDRQFTLQEVPEALKYYAGGHARGKISIKIDSGD